MAIRFIVTVDPEAEEVLTCEPERRPPLDRRSMLLGLVVGTSVVPFWRRFSLTYRLIREALD